MSLGPMRWSWILLVAPPLALGAASQARAHDSPEGPIAELTRRIQAHPDSLPLYLSRGELRRIQGDFAGAEADYDQVERRDPAHPRLDVCRAALAFDTGDPASARRLLDRTLAARPGDPAALRLRSRASIALGDQRGAIADLSAAIERLASPHPDLYLERARLQVAEGDRATALAGLDAARQRLGPVVSLDLYAIELAEGRPVVAEEAPVVEVQPPGDGRSASVARIDATGATQAVVTRGPYLQMGTTTAITVRWRTDTATNTWVRYGTTPGNLASSASNATLTTEHELRVTGLVANTRYYYSVGTSTGALAGDVTYTFRTAPVAAAAGATRIWVVGDSGLPGADAIAVRDAYAAWTGARPTNLWLMLGDNAYTNGTDSEYQAGVFDQYPVMLRQTVLWPTRGNHDILYSGSNNDYYEIFTMPAAAQAGGVASGTEAYYSFDWADIHFICLDSEGSSRAPGSAMLTWLASDLAASSRTWVIVFWHHPPYTKGSHNSDDPTDSGGRMRDMRENVVPILEAAGVDLVLTGHSHSYERSFLIDGHYGLSSTFTQAMKVWPGDGRINGNGYYRKPPGAPPSDSGEVFAVAGSSSRIEGGSLNHPAMVTSLNVLGSMVLDVGGNRLDARFVSHTGAVLDSFTIIKGSAVDVGPGPVVEAGLELGPGVPNPFSLDTRFSFTLPRAGHARLTLLDLAGRRVATLADGWHSAGAHGARWDGHDSRGHLMPTGVYLAVLEAGGARISRKIAYVR